jgi:glycosyltransferase involved in cell wall biosynthesis
LQNLEVDLRALNLRNVSLAVCDYANVGNARNIALQMLNTEWICFLDADDLLNLSNCLTLIDELSKEEISINHAKINTLGSRAEDTFLITYKNHLKMNGILILLQILQLFHLV